MNYLQERTNTLNKYRINIPNVNNISKDLVRLVYEAMPEADTSDDLFRYNLSSAFDPTKHPKRSTALNNNILPYFQAINTSAKIDQIFVDQLYYYSSKESPLEIHVRFNQRGKDQNIVFFLKKHNDRRILSLVLLDQISAGYPFMYEYPNQEQSEVDERLQTKIGNHLKKRKMLVEPYSIIEWKVQGEHLETFAEKQTQEYHSAIGKILAITESFSIDDIITNTRNILLKKRQEGSLDIAFIDAVELFSPVFNLENLQEELVTNFEIPQKQLHDIYLKGRQWFKKLLRSKKIMIDIFIEECISHNVSFTIDNREISIAQKLQQIIQESQSFTSPFPKK